MDFVLFSLVGGRVTSVRWTRTGSQENVETQASINSAPAGIAVDAEEISFLASVEEKVRVFYQICVHFVIKNPFYFFSRQT